MATEQDRGQLLSRVDEAIVDKVARLLLYPDGQPAQVNSAEDIARLRYNASWSAKLFAQTYGLDAEASRATAESAAATVMLRLAGREDIPPSWLDQITGVHQGSEQSAMTTTTRTDAPETSQSETPQPAIAGGNGGGGHRINVNFSDQAYQTLEDLSEMTGKSMSEVLREALALKAWFEATQREGDHILVEKSDGRIREVISV